MTLKFYWQIYRWRIIYDYKLDIRAHKNAWFWHHSPLLRYLRELVYDFKFRLVARFITKHKLWWNHEDAKRWERYT